MYTFPTISDNSVVDVFLGELGEFPTWHRFQGTYLEKYSTKTFKGEQ